MFRTPEDDLIDELVARLSLTTVHTTSDVRPLVRDFVMAGGDKEKFTALERVAARSSAVTRSGHSPAYLMRVVVDCHLLKRPPLPKLNLAAVL